MKTGHFTKISRFIKKDPKLEALLKQLDVPDIDPDIRRNQIAKLSRDIQGGISGDEENTFN